MVVAVAVAGFQATRAALALRSVRAEGAAMQAQLTSGDFAAARRSLGALTGHASTARDATDGVLWNLAAKLPLLGDDVRAVQTVTDVLATVSRRSLPSAVLLSEAIDTGAFRPRDGQFDLAAIERLQPTLGAADGVVAAQNARLRALRPAGLLPVLRPVLTDLQQRLGAAATAADASSRAVRLLPGMLGEDGPRTYLLVVQNNAEIRATGGLPGSFSVLRAVDGKLTMGFQGAAEDVSSRGQAQDLSDDERAVYGDSMGTDVRDANLTPDFPRAAELIAAMFEARRRTPVDGVVAVDPTALAAVLKGTGPVRLPSGEQLSADDVVAKLLNQTYSRFSSPTKQNDYFADVARATFDGLMTGNGDQLTTFRGLARAGGEHRLLIWSGDAAEQQVLEGSAVAGALPDADGSPRVGMYLNDATAAKMEYYLDYRTSLTSSQCTAEGQQSLEASMLLESTVPARFEKLSKWILGFGDYAPRGSMQMNLRVYAPQGGSITQVTVDSRAVAITADTHDGRQVATVPVLLAPGQKMLVAATIRGAAGQRGDAVLDFTPGMRSQPNGVRVTSPCG